MLGTSGCFCFVALLIVTERVNLFGVIISTSRAGKGFNPLRGTSGIGCHYTFVVSVSKCVYIGVNISITAMAGMSSKAFFGASRCGYHRVVSVTKCINLLGVGITASSARKGLNAIIGTSRSGGDYTVIVRMTKCVNIGINVYISAVTGMSCESFFGASRRSCGGSMRMSSFFYRSVVLLL